PTRGDRDLRRCLDRGPSRVRGGRPMTPSISDLMHEILALGERIHDATIAQLDAVDEDDRVSVTCARARVGALAVALGEIVEPLTGVVGRLREREWKLIGDADDARQA